MGLVNTKSYLQPSRSALHQGESRQWTSRCSYWSVHVGKRNILWWTLCQRLWLLCSFLRKTLSHRHYHRLYSLIFTSWHNVTKCLQFVIFNHLIVLETHLKLMVNRQSKWSLFVALANDRWKGHLENLLNPTYRNCIQIHCLTTFFICFAHKICVHKIIKYDWFK